jgi:prepilin-type processing-associated H-X9-DG protein
MMRNARWIGAAGRPLLAVAIMLLTFALLELTVRPPAPLPATAPAEQNSAGRAMQTLERLIGDSNSHPIGTAQNAAVRQRVVDEMTSQGLTVETQASFTCHPVWGVCAEVTNVMARLPGTTDGPAVLLTAHYDSVAAGPGAGDDMAGVAALLEVARVLRASPPLASPIVLLFTDGEEIALLGAQAFVSGHPWGQDIGVVVNLEASGTSGQSILFETTHQSRWLVQTLAGAVPRLVGNAFADSLYTLFPFNTDVNVYETAGIPAVNFAFVDGHAQYHTPLDAPRNIDPGSVQHHGDNALAASRAFAAQDLRDPPPGESIYADLAPGLFVSWPREWTLGIALALAVGWVLVAALTIRQGSVGTRQVLWGLLATPITLVIAVLAGFVVGLLAQWSSGASVPWYAYPRPLRVVLWAVALVVAGSVASLLWRRAGARGLFYGVWLIWSVLAVAVAALWPAASFLLLVPALAALIPALLLLLPALRASAWAMPAAIGIGLFAAGWMWLWFARGSDFAALSPEFAATAALAIALTATAGAGLLAILATARRTAGTLVGGLLLLGVAAVVIGAVVPVYSATSPQPVNVLRIEDTRAGQVSWALEAEGRAPVAMLATRQFGGQPVQALPWQARRQPVAPGSEGLAVDGPARDISRGSGEPLRLTLPAAPDGSHVAVYLPQQAGAVALSLTRQGREQEVAVPPVEDGYQRFLCVAPACNGAALDVTLTSDEPFMAFVVQNIAGLPAEDQAMLDARPQTATPRHRGDATILVERINVAVEQEQE